MGIFDGFDFRTLAQLLSFPGIDPRQWVSIAIVDPDTPQARSVQFNDEEGNPLPHPLVNVTLQPGGLEVSARVLASGSGAQIGEWHPFVAGDEVLVLIPSGNESMGCVIVGRLSNSLDVHPTSVAGNDTTQNNLAFKRFVEPYVMESGTAILFRISTTGSFIALDPTGNATIQNGGGHYLAIHDDFISLQTKDTSCLVQIDPVKQTVLLQAAGTQFFLDSAGKSHLLTRGQLSLFTSGGGYAPGHAVTIEQLAAVFNSFGVAAAAAASTPITLVAFFASMSTPATLAAIITAASTAPGGVIAGPISAAIATGLQATPDPSGSLPGIGRPGLLF